MLAHPAELACLIQDGLAGERNDQEAVDQLVVERQVEALLDRRHHDVGGEARVVRRRLQEIEKCLHVGGV